MKTIVIFLKLNSAAHKSLNFILNFTVYPRALCTDQVTESYFEFPNLFSTGNEYLVFRGNLVENGLTKFV